MSDPSHTTADPNPTMKVSINPQRATELLQNLTSITTRISTTTSKLTIQRPKPVRLVAVSKLKPASDVLALYNPTDPSKQQLHFGENYMQELLEKSKLLPTGIKWHFIGALQTNKCVSLARDVQGLWAVESVDSSKKADRLDKGWSERESKDGVEDQLRVFVQVNTSGEESKSGVEPADAVELCRHIRDKCPGLRLQGLMTIGAIARSQATTAENENENFITLREIRGKVCAELGLQEEMVELSMGMSEDFEGAIMQGSAEVRVGSTIFGTRPPKAEAKVLDDAQDAKS